jgi:putative aldouronate transport system permease protein
MHCSEEDQIMNVREINSNDTNSGMVGKAELRAQIKRARCEEKREEKLETMNSSTHKVRHSASYNAFTIFGIILMTALSVICILPFIMLVSGSFTDESYIITHGYGLWPKVFSLEAYKALLMDPSMILKAYGVTIVVTVFGTAISMIVLSMASYVLSRNDFQYRNKFSFYFYFTTLFNGGLLSTYIFMVRYYQLKNNLLSLIIPYMVNIFYMLILRSFMKSVPVSLIESAKIDGGEEFVIFWKIVMPLSKSGLATIGLFVALDYWNDWYNAMLYINKDYLFPLQYMLYSLMQRKETMERMAAQTGAVLANMPSNSMKLAMAVIATGPIILVYPFCKSTSSKELRLEQ